MKIGSRPFGGKYTEYVLENEAGTVLTVLDLGAAVTGLVYRGVDIVLGAADPAEYETNSACLGAVVGRCANRIAGARFSLHGREYSLDANEGTNCLHGGFRGYHTRRWSRVDGGEGLTLALDSPDGDQGFPGRLRLTVTYVLTEDDRVHIRYRAESDADTLVGLTNHAYFNLNGQGIGDVLSHELRLFADAYTPVRSDLIPTGEIVPVEGTPFDFRAAKAVGRDILFDHEQLRLAGGYDHNFVLAGVGLRPAAVLCGDLTGITLSVETDMPGVQLYTGNFLAGLCGKGGTVYPKHGGLCLETQQFPDAIHHGAFPSPVVRAGETFSSETVWTLGREESFT